MKRLVGVAPLVLMLLLSCASHTAVSAASETMLKEDAAYSERLLKSETDSPDANLKEFDDFCDRSVELRTERLIKLQASLSEHEEALAQDIVDHFNAENSLVRAKRRFFDAYSELRGLSARYYDITRQAKTSSALGEKYKVTEEEVQHVQDQNDQDLEKTLERAKTAMLFMEQARNYTLESARLAATVNAAAVKTLDAGKSYTESLGRALETEKRLARESRRVGFKIDTPIIASANDATSRAAAALTDVQSKVIK